jgi:GAF domain-containing protein
MSMKFDPNVHAKRIASEVHELERIFERLHQTMERDQLVQSITNKLRDFLQVDRVVVYHFYTQWRGQVTFEALSNDKFSILGSTGPDGCFSGEYAGLYLAGRVRAIPDIEKEPIEDCHRDFLRYLQVRANLAVPILTAKGLWGLLVAHHCQGVKAWTESEIEEMQAGSLSLASAPSIQQN